MMLELLQTAPLSPADVPQAAPPLRVVADGLLSIGFVTAVARIGRRAVMGHYLPDDLSHVDADAARVERDPKAIVVMALAYVAGVALTSAAVYLAATLALALAWAGTCALVAAVVALLAAKDATPVDDMRLLAESRRGD